MSNTSIVRIMLLLGVAPVGLLRSQPAISPQPTHVFFRVQVADSVPAPVSGQLLIFVKSGSGDREIDNEPFHPDATWVAAKEVRDVAPGGSIEVDGDENAFPKPFSNMPAGDYEAQAVLDVGHRYNYSGRVPEDWMSGVKSIPHWTPGTGTEPVLVLEEHPRANAQNTAAFERALARLQSGAGQREEMVSPLLSRFWGHSVSIRAWVILPPNYGKDERQRYPTVYWTHGFGGNLDRSLLAAMAIRDRMEKGKMPPMIWVFLDESLPEGTHEFADSVNNGPWGTALTTEFLPYVEGKYRMDARRDGRFLNGHSSGGWATLQLEVNYPRIFGGTWSTSPDPSDFHDFTGPDLYAPEANLYRKPDGTPWPIMRADGRVVATIEQFARLERVLGPFGGQIASFEWVFSPKSESGAPEPMFDRETGAVNPRVVAYWRDHYDLAHLVEANWDARGGDLKGRIHVLVGTADTFYLDGAAHRFEAVLNRLGGDPHFTYLPDRTHFDLYAVGKDKEALFDRISAEMYAVARPRIEWKAKE